MTARPTIRIRLFAQARELLGREEMDVECEGITTAGELRAHLARRHPDLAPLLDRSALAVNLEYVDDCGPLRPGDDVAIVPPVAGG